MPSHRVGLGLQEVHPPPTEYPSPDSSDDGSRRNSSDTENTPLIQVINRNRGASAATVRTSHTSVNASTTAAMATRIANTTATPHPEAGPPIPSYTDAVRQGAGRDRSDSAMSNRRQAP